MKFKNIHPATYFEILPTHARISVERKVVGNDTISMGAAGAAVL